MINYRLASAINPPASPSTNLRFHWSSDLQLLPWISPPTCVGDQPCGLCQRPTPNFPGDCILRSLLQLSLRLASAAAPPVFPQDQLPILRRPLAFQLTFQPTSDSRRISHRPVLPSNPTASFHRLPCPPAFLSDRPSTCAEYRIFQFCLPTNLRLIIGYRISDFAFRSASDLRRRSIFQLCLPTNLPTCAGCYVLGLFL